MKATTREKDIYRVTIIGSIVNILLLILKFFSGIIGHSSALIADAMHSLSDFVTDVIVIVFVRISSKPADKSHNYGHGKFETLATAIIGVALFAVGIGILVGGVEDIVAVYNGEVLPAPGLIALIIPAVSIISKEWLYRYTVSVGKSLESQAVIANAWHHRSDAFSSIGVLLGVGGAYFGGEKWRVLDPIAAVIVSVFIIKVAVDILKNSMEELLEHSLPDSTEDEILQIILSVDGVKEPHHLRTRRIGNNCAIEVHIRINGQVTLLKAHEITTDVELLLKRRFGEKTHIIIHTEPLKMHNY